MSSSPHAWDTPPKKLRYGLWHEVATCKRCGLRAWRAWADAPGAGWRVFYATAYGRSETAPPCEKAAP